MKKVFQANDGKVFYKETDCIEYETDLKKSISREQLARLCALMHLKINNDLADNEKHRLIGAYMADYIIDNVRQFGLALSPFISGSK